MSEDADGKKISRTTAARLVFRWNVPARVAERFQDELVDTIEGFRAVRGNPRVIRPLSFAQTSEWAVELNFPSHAALGAFLNDANVTGSSTVGGENDFLKSLHRVSSNVEGVEAAGTEGMVVSVVWPALIECVEAAGTEGTTVSVEKPAPVIE